MHSIIFKMKSIYLLLTILSIAYANKCSSHVDSTTGELKWDSITDGTTIPANAFYDCRTIKSGVLTGVTSVGESAFESAGDPVGMDLTFPDLTIIEDRVFRSSNLKSLSAPKVTTLRNGNFAGSYDPPVSVETGTFARAGIPAGMELDLPELTYIGYGAFQATSLKSLFSPKVTSITSNSFYKCNENSGHKGLELNFPLVTTISPYKAFASSEINVLRLTSLTNANGDGQGTFSFMKVSDYMAVLTPLIPSGGSYAPLDLSNPNADVNRQIDINRLVRMDYMYSYLPDATDAQIRSQYQNRGLVSEERASFLQTASDVEIRTQYQNRSLAAGDLPSYLPLASPDQLKTEYQSRGSCA